MSLVSWPHLAVKITHQPLGLPPLLFSLPLLHSSLSYSSSLLWRLLSPPFYFLYFVPLPPIFSLFSMSSPLPPLLNPVCYPSSPCRQRSLTTDSLLPFLLPNPYTTSRYWLHAELVRPRPPPFPLAFPAASPLASPLIKRHQCILNLGFGSVLNQHFLLYIIGVCSLTLTCTVKVDSLQVSRRSLSCSASLCPTSHFKM